MREEAFQHVVLKYLKEKGYRSAEQAFRNEARVHTLNEMALSGASGGFDTGSVTNAVYLYANSDTDPSRYPESFRRLRGWVESSLDLYKNELSRVLYPVFVNCYLELVSKGHSKVALQMMEDEKASFLEKGPRAARNANELLDLMRVSLPEDLETNETAKRIRKTFRVNMCQYSYELLKSFLHGSGLLLLLAIVNEHLKIDVVPGGPSALEEEEEEEGAEDLAAAVGHSEVELVALNQREINWGMLEGTLEDQIEEKKEPAAKKSKKAQPKAKKEGVGAGAPRVKASIPLPTPDEENDLAALADLRRRVRLGPAALPSVCLFTFLNTQQGLNAASFSADGSRVVGGFADSSVRVYDMERASSGGESSSSGPQYLRLAGHSGPVYGARFTHDHSHILSCSGDNTVRLWNMEMGANLVCYKGHNFPVWDVAPCPAGHYFATASRDRTARIWAVDRAQPLRVLAGHLADVDCVAWHSNCSYVATGSSDNSVRLWDVNTGTCVRVLAGHHAAVSSIAMSPDGRTLASGGGDGSLMLWDLGSGRRLGALGAHKGSVWSLDYSGEGKLLASGGSDACVNLWDVTSSLCESLDSKAPGGGGGAGDGGSGGGSAAGGGGFRLLKSLRTKSTPVFTVGFTRRNLLLAAGPFINPSAKSMKP